MRRANSQRKNLVLGKTEGKRRGSKRWDGGSQHTFSRCEFEQTLGDSEGQRSLACSRGHKASGMPEQLNEEQQRHESELPWASDKNLLSTLLLKCKCPLQFFQLCLTSLHRWLTIYHIISHVSRSRAAQPEQLHPINLGHTWTWFRWCRSGSWDRSLRAQGFWRREGCVLQVGGL